MKTFTKFGSCVVSDIFNWMNINNYYVQYNHTGFNVESLLNKATFTMEDTDFVADNNFSLKMTKMMFNHESFRDYIKTLDSDYFIFDFGDERLPNQKWENEKTSCIVPVTWNSYRTSLKVKESHDNNIKISDWHLSNRLHDVYRKQITEYINIIREHYDDDHIIYICSRQAEDYINRKENKIEVLSHEKNKGINKDDLRVKEQKVISEAEGILLDIAPNIWKIEFPSNIVADEAHHFSVHPLHFHHCVYKYLADCLELIVDYNGQFSKSKIYINMQIKKHVTENKLSEIRFLFS